jgi:hypothetical protein
LVGSKLSLHAGLGFDQMDSNGLKQKFLIGFGLVLIEIV